MKCKELDIDHLKWDYKNLKCEIIRNNFKCWCGYVFLPIGHPWRKKDFQEQSFLNIESEVHGGITYLSKEKIGFDCHHAYDISPMGFTNSRNYADMRVNKRLRQEEPSYKDVYFAIDHTEILANEVIEAIVK